MYDSFNRNINYLRISVTDRCNLRCRYCMPEEGISWLNHSDILSYEEIVEVVRVGIELGISKVRLTGGEPLVRKGIVHLVEQLSSLKGLNDLSLTTNAQKLADFAFDLKRAGMKRINISLDTVDEVKYATLTRGGDIQQVFSGIDTAIMAGLHPVKLNCVIENSPEEEDARGVAEYARRKNLSVRFIHRMTLEKGYFTKVEGGEGGNCSICNRLRLTANGKLKPCLFSDLEFDVRQMGIRAAFDAAVEAKPRCGTANHNNMFYNIGG